MVTRSSRFHRLVLALTGLACLLATPTALARTADLQARNHWHDALTANYQALADEASELSRQTVAACENGSPWPLETLQDQWRQTFLAWQAVRYVDFGPVEQNSRAWRIQFWPDRKNLVAGKTELWLLGERTPTIEGIAADSVAVQGLPALEFLLFDPAMMPADGQPPEARTCQLLVAVAGNLESVTRGLATDWRSFKPHFLATRSYNDAMVSAAMSGLEILQDRRLAEPMGLGGSNRRNGYLAETWRSGQSLAGLEATVSGLERSFLPGLEPLLAAAGKADLRGQLEGQFDATFAVFEDLPAAMVPLLDDDAGYARLQELYIEISQLSQLVSGRVAPALGVVRGFNSSDGD